MKGLTRRGFAIGAAGLGGLGLAVAGGSLAFCAADDGQEAVLIRPLFVALEDMIAPERVGRAWWETIGTPPQGELLQRRDLRAVSMIVPPEARRDRMRGVVRAEFARGDIVLADGFVVSRAEALIAATWVA